MIDILASLHKYVPTVSTTENVLVDGKSDEIVEDKFSKVLLGRYIAIQLYMCVYASTQNKLSFIYSTRW